MENKDVKFLGNIYAEGVYSSADISGAEAYLGEGDEVYINSNGITTPQIETTSIIATENFVLGENSEITMTKEQLSAPKIKTPTLEVTDIATDGEIRIGDDVVFNGSNIEAPTVIGDYLHAQIDIGLANDEVVIDTEGIHLQSGTYLGFVGSENATSIIDDDYIFTPELDVGESDEVIIDQSGISMKEGSKIYIDGEDILEKKADKNVTYTKTEVDSFLEGKANTADSLSGYGITNAYTKTEVDSKLNEKADSATTLLGYGITDAYTKEQTYNRTQIDDLLAEGGFQGDWQADKGEPGYIQNKPDLVNFETQSISTPDGGIYIDDDGVSVTQNYDINESSYIHTTSTVTHTGFHLDYLRENEDSGTVTHSYIDLGWAEKMLSDTSGSPGITVRNHDGSQSIRITDTDILRNGVSIIPKTKYLYLLSHSDDAQEWTRIINFFYLSDTKITTATVSSKDLVYGTYPVWGYEMYGRSGEALEFTLHKSIEIKKDSLVLNMIQHDNQSSTSSTITQLIFSVTSYGKTIV